MTITSTPFQQDVNVAIDGRIDTANYLEFEQAITALLNEGVKQLFLDCSQASRKSSTFPAFPPSFPSSQPRKKQRQDFNV